MALVNTFGKCHADLHVADLLPTIRFIISSTCQLHIYRDWNRLLVFQRLTFIMCSDWGFLTEKGRNTCLLFGYDMGEGKGRKSKGFYFLNIGVITGHKICKLMRNFFDEVKSTNAATEKWILIQKLHRALRFILSGTSS